MSQCKAQHVVGSETRFCLGEEGTDHWHSDYLGHFFAAEPASSGVEVVDFAEITIEGADK